MAAREFSQLSIAVNERHLDDHLGYPPFVLRTFRALTSENHAASCDGYLWAKFATCGVLVLIWFVILPRWQSLSLPELAPFWIAIGVALSAGWNRPLQVDLAAGNVTVFEQLLVWLGLLAGITALVICVLPHLASFVFDQSAYLDYVGVVQRMSEEARGETNPSSYALIRDVVDHVSRQGGTGGGLMQVLGGALHARAVALVLWLTLATGGLCFYLISSWRLRLDRRPLLLVSQACFCLACFLPRFKMYSYLLVVPPTLYTLQAVP